MKVTRKQITEDAVYFGGQEDLEELEEWLRPRGYTVRFYPENDRLCLDSASLTYETLPPYGWILQLEDKSLLLVRKELFDDNYVQDVAVHDYSTAIVRFVECLKELGDHIGEHNLIEDAAKVKEECYKAIDMWGKFNEAPYPEDDKAWKDFWKYISRNMRGWWD